jgi:hypothetical protein
MPNRPTSPHWYSPARFQQLLAGYLLADRRTGRRRTVREVIAEFDGLSGVKVRQEVAFDTGLEGVAKVLICYSLGVSLLLSNPKTIVWPHDPSNPALSPL